MTPTGASLIAGRSVVGTAGSTRAHNPATGEALGPEFGYAGPEDLAAATRAATEAFEPYRATSPSERAAFLDLIADNLDAARDAIVARAVLESGLTEARLFGEHARTVNQLRLFAREVRLGEHHGVRIDEAQPDRQPIPAPDIRQRQISIGPVLVFGASNFPLAFSTAGGDTASALAAGCPVIVKAHNSHAGTAELAGRAISDAVAQSGLPAGVFSIIFGAGSAVGQALAQDPAIKAIAFTGSQAAGTALMATAAARPEPIPVYAEMSSINPVILLPGAVAECAEALATGFVGSLTLGAGQFCTNPGLIFVPAGQARFVEAVGELLRESVGQTMLSANIAAAYTEGLERLADAGVTQVATGAEGATLNAPAPALFTTTAAHFRDSPDMQEEVFGAAALVVTYDDQAELRETLREMQGQLTATIHAAIGDQALAADLLPVLETMAGRILFNGWPTGVEVTHAMVHGGPFPATSNAMTTSVGTLAIQRFLRPVSYQNLPASLLPEPLRVDNPWHLPRRLNGMPQT
ncbi:MULTISPECIES: aldehyde dehydrogenase (NADP(+)) [unclassified Nocardioides]|uniref:aldehyde dehydrogenase (NADP(+)) n=1 Tax=unclassified Nocardioides TaxID=2615069 RepID=UPI000056F51F|nr:MULTISPECIES: aldehyde dehydrogenase (NADP(+)) [unclassified Nocardioides]ABL83696.1 aldehyde dehydrogenase [Nocardioides sp. JS614]